MRLCVRPNIHALSCAHSIFVAIDQRLKIPSQYVFIYRFPSLSSATVPSRRKTIERRGERTEGNELG